MVRIQRVHCYGLGSIPGLRTEIPQAMYCGPPCSPLGEKKDEDNVILGDSETEKISQVCPRTHRY